MKGKVQICENRFINSYRRDNLMQDQSHCRVVLVPCPFQGHITPMLQLGTILHSKGFSITVAHTIFNSPDPSSHPDFNFESIDDGLTDDDLGSGNLVVVISSLNRNCEIPLRKFLSGMKEEQNSEGQTRISCVIYDELMYFSQIVASHLKLPSIILRTTSAATLISRAAILQLKEEGCIPWQDNMLQEPVPNLHPLRYKDLPVSKFGTPENFLQLIANACDTRTSSAIIWNTTYCLEETLITRLQHQSLVPIFAVGPMHKFAPSSSSSLLKEDSDSIKWLDKQSKNSVLYISLGSLASAGEKELVELAWGLANSEKPFLWAVRPGSVLGSEWIEKLPEGLAETVGRRSCIVKWAAQRQVLAHPAVGGFFSHCGWNSILESISKGVPLICKPCFGDQRVNARYLSHEWGIGLQLEDKFDRHEIEGAIRTLMESEKGHEMRAKAKHFQEKVTISTSKGGCSYNSVNKLLNFLRFSC